MEKIGGVGLVNLIVITLFIWLVTVGAKAVLTKYPVPGLSQIVQAV